MIPHQVVVLAPGTRFVEGQLVMIAVTGHIRPLQRELLRRPTISAGAVRVSGQFRKHGVRAECFDGLQ